MPRLRQTTLAIAAAMAFSGGGGGGGVHAAVTVFDPTNYAQNVEQVRHHVELADRMRQQIDHQLRMLQGWEFTRIHRLLNDMERTRSVFDDARRVYRNGQPGAELDDAFPIDRIDAAAGEIEAMRRAWDDRHRDTLVEGRALQNAVYRTLDGTADRVGDYVRRSNAAPGMTSAVQAGNEVLATVAAQVQALQALEVAEGRAAIELEARAQAEAAFHAERQRWLMRDWGRGASAEPVAAFGD